MIGALVICLLANPNACQRTEFKVVDRTICHIPAKVEQIDVGGVWQDAKLQVVCGR